MPSGNRKECIAKLVEKNANVNIRGDSTALTNALEFDDDSQYCFEVLMKAGADPNVLHEGLFTPLQHAVLRNNLNRTEKLIRVGADVNLAGTRYPAIVTAALNGGEDILKCLIAAGADVNKETRPFTPLLAASDRGHIGCVKQLIQAGAELNKAMNDDDEIAITPLMSASAEGHMECVKQLIQAGADLNVMDTNSRPALVHATLGSKNA